MSDMEKIYIQAVREDFGMYCQHIHNTGCEGEGKRWKPTRFHKKLCAEVQEFVETDTGHAYDVLLVMCPPQHGKLLADDTPVLTKDGWRRHGDLAVGDCVVSPDGKFVKVTHIHPKYHTEYRVSFTNGESVECHGRHEWVVRDRNKIKTLETREILRRGIETGEPNKRGHRYLFKLPRKEILDCPDKGLHVDPYTLGAWLGDGTNTKPCVCSCPEDSVVLDNIAYPKSSESVHKDTGIITRYYKGLNYDLQKYGMCYYHERVEKHIPEAYLTASKKQRLELLAGLLDTDGYCDRKHNRYVFTTAEGKLKDSFITLVSTFGWHVSEYTVHPQLSSSGIQGKRDYWQLAFNPTIHIPCRLERKRMYRFSKQRRDSICKIEKIEPTQGNCITVDGGVYCVGQHLIPTHNSMTISESLPSWWLGHHPEGKVIVGCYNSKYSKKFGLANRRNIEDHGYLFNQKLSTDSKAIEDFRLDNGYGRFICRGLLSGITGNAGDLIIIDDPVKNAQEAGSKTTRDKIWSEYVQTIKTRTSRGAKIIIIMTPWHEDDLSGRVQKTEKHIKVLRFPVKCDSDSDPLGRELGDALCPEIGKNNNWLEDFKESFIGGDKFVDGATGRRAWEAMFMCSPTSEEGNILKREWWKYYKQLPNYLDSVIMSVDCAFKNADNNDYVAIQVWAKAGANYYLIKAIKERLDFPETVEAIVTVKNMFPVIKEILIEDKANGPAVVSVLENRISGIIPVNPIGGKEARVNAISYLVEAGNVYLPMYDSKDFVESCAAFPHGKHDDDVDAFSQALNRLVFTRIHSRAEEEQINQYKYIRLGKPKSRGKGKIIVV